MDNNYLDTLLARWMAGEISDEEFRSHVSSEDFLLYRKIKKGSEVLAGLHRVEKDVKRRIREQMVQKRRRSSLYLRLRQWSAVAAVLILGLVAYIYFFGQMQELTVRTAMGQQKEIRLPDGSFVLLKELSELTYKPKEWPRKRKIRLKGAAYFSVAKKKPPFEVRTPHAIVTVLGTRFEVLDRGTKFLSVCYEGKVAVHLQEKKWILTPGSRVALVGDSLRYDKSDISLQTEKRFTDVPLSEVLDQMEKIYGLHFQTSRVNTTQHYTGTFDIRKNKEDNLRLILSPFGIRYRMQGDTVILYPSR